MNLRAKTKTPPSIMMLFKKNFGEFNLLISLCIPSASNVLIFGTFGRKRFEIGLVALDLMPTGKTQPSPVR